MPQNSCSQCGALYDLEPTLSNKSMQKSLLRTRLAALVSFLLALVATVLTWINWPTPPFVLPYEATGPGIVRYYDYPRRMIIHENSHGFIKVLQPVCSQQVGVWIHMQANIRYTWNSYHTFHQGRGPDANEECYDILNVQRIGPDVQ